MEKEKWRRLVRFRYLLGRMKLNRVVLAWRVWVRRRKVTRLRTTMIEFSQ